MARGQGNSESLGGEGRGERQARGVHLWPVRESTQLVAGSPRVCPVSRGWVEWGEAEP